MTRPEVIARRIWLHAQIAVYRAELAALKVIQRPHRCRECDQPGHKSQTCPAARRGATP